MVEESDEGNNVYGPVNVSILWPDLIVSGVVPDPMVGEPWVPFNVSVTIENLGGADANGFDVDIYYNSSGPPPMYEDGDDFAFVDNLEAGRNMTINFTVEYGSSGNYSFWAQVDPLDGVAESREDNNVYGPVNVSILWPDLRVEISPDPIYACVGQQIWYELIVFNDGAANASNFYVDAYHNLNQSPVPGQHGDVRVQVDFLAANDSVTLDSFPHPSNPTPGESEFWAQVDSDQDVSESNEGNNIDGPVPVYNEVCPTSTPTATATATPTCILGDATNDGIINAGDITKVERIILGWDAETPCSDANQDGTTNTSDIGTVEYMILGIWPWNHVHIEAPDNLPYCTHFNATVFITYVEDFGSASLNVSYSPSVLALEGVTGGQLMEIDPGISADFYTVNVTEWSQPGGAGTLLVNASIDGNPGPDGAGYLARLHFHVIGSAGQTSPIAFNVSQSWMKDDVGGLINSSWGDTSLTVGYTPYEADKEQIEAAVAEFMTRPTDPAYNHTIGEVPKQGYKTARINSSNISGPEVIPGEWYYPIAICPLTTHAFPKGILKNVPASVHTDNHICGGANNASYGADPSCLDTVSEGHYKWYTTDSGDVISICRGYACTDGPEASGTNADGFQDVYP